jgi:hypothetical protein
MIVKGKVPAVESSDDGFEGFFLVFRFGKEMSGAKADDTAERGSPVARLISVFDGVSCGDYDLEADLAVLFDEIQLVALGSAMDKNAPFGIDEVQRYDIRLISVDQTQVADVGLVQDFLEIPDFSKFPIFSSHSVPSNSVMESLYDPEPVKATKNDEISPIDKEKPAVYPKYT